MLFLIVFVPLLLVVLLVVWVVGSIVRSRENNQLRAMLRTADPVIAERSVELLRPVSVQGSLTRFLESVGMLHRLELLLNQAGLNWSGTQLVSASLIACLIGIVVGTQVPFAGPQALPSIVLSVAGLVVPFLIARRKRSKRIAAFEEQFPEALDFLSRSLRAGHAFSVGLEMLVADSAEPLASVFRRTLTDLHLGSPLEVALRKMIDVVPIVDVRFFIASVVLQQETGGNLSEILSNLAHVIRDRFRLKGQVKAASAHGRITALVLLCMPIAVAAFMMVTSPSYLKVLTDSHVGRVMLTGAVVAQLIGYFCIKKIVNIKV